MQENITCWRNPGGNNSTAIGFANRHHKLKCSKAMDMRFHWIPDRVDQGQLTIEWAPGDTNLADYFTKHHNTAHHIKMRPIYLHMSNLVQLVPPLTLYIPPLIPDT